MTLQEIKSKFKKVCINKYLAILSNGERQWYRRGDLDNWSKEAFDRNKPYFYVEPVDPNNPYGELRLCEPEYRYMLNNPLTEEEYQYLFNQNYEYAIDVLRELSPANPQPKTGGCE